MLHHNDNNNKQYGSKPKRRRSWCRAVACWCGLFLAVPAMVAVTSLASLARVENLQSGNDERFQWADVQHSLESCTYEQLEKAFGTEATRNHDDNDKCWRLSDRILQVPQNAILNFDNPIRLGKGCKGGVFLVFLSLSDLEPPCKAVYKTDLVHTHLCDGLWTHPFSSPCGCLASKLNPFRTSMQGELTGGVVFQAFEQYRRDHPNDPKDFSGILPTWAIVPLHGTNSQYHHHRQGIDDELTAEEDRHLFLRHDHHDHHAHNGNDYPGVKGIIMPLKHFSSLEPSVAHERTAADIAALLQNVVQGLAFVHELGLAHQDLVSPKNLGVVHDPIDGTLSHSILLDWGYTAVDDNIPADDDEQSCTLGRACDFCQESYFPAPRVGPNHGTPHSRRRTLDCQNMAAIVASLWDEVQDSRTAGRYWQKQMLSTVNCSRSTQELADFLAVVAKGRR